MPTPRLGWGATPRELVQHYERAGYDVLAVTDHWDRSDPPSTNGVARAPRAPSSTACSPGTATATCSRSGSRPPDDARGERRDLAETADWIIAERRCRLSRASILDGRHGGVLELPEAVSGIEVFNAGCELEVGRGLSAVHWDEILGSGRRCFALATDDTHHPGFDSDLAWTWVRGARTEAGVLDALRSGCFYASTGPLITDVKVPGGKVEVRCSPCRSVTLNTGRSSGAAVHAGRLGYRYGAEIDETTDEGLIVAATLALPETAPYARIEVVDALGRTAWSNPVDQF